MKIILLVIVSCFIVASSFAQNDSIFRVSDFNNAKIIYRLSKMPPEVIKGIKANSNEAMADSGEFYNGTDVKSAGAPNLRIIVFLILPRYYILFYNRGGFVSTQFCILFKRKGDKIKTVNRLDMKDYCDEFPNAKTFGCLENELLNNKFESHDTKFGYW